MKQHSTPRFLVVALLLTGTAAFLYVRHKTELTPKGEPVNSFPIHVGGWRGQDERLDDNVLAILGPGDFLSRTYTRPNQPFISLFLAYFASQQTGDTIHSPKNCLPGSGWTPLESSRILLVGPTGQKIPANRYIIQKGTDRQLVIYWYQAHGRAVASEYMARFYLFADAMRMNRTDGALIRVITPVPDGRNGAAEVRAREFIKQILPNLDMYVPL